MKLFVCKDCALEHDVAVVYADRIAKYTSLKNGVGFDFYISFQILLTLRQDACFDNIILKEKIIVIKPDFV